MSDKKIDIDIIINSANAAKSVGDLKKVMKDLSFAQENVASSSPDFKKLSAAINDVEGRVGELGDKMSVSIGSGVDRINTSFDLFKEGLASGDIDKAKVGFKGLGAAMDAIPILLLIEGLKMLWDNLDEVKKILFAIFPGLDSVSQATKDLERANNKLKETTKVLVASLENELALAESLGKSDKEILDIKKELNRVKEKEIEGNITLEKQKVRDIIANDDLYESILKLESQALRKLGQEKEADALEKAYFGMKQSRAKESLDKIKEDQIALAKLKNDDKIIQNEYDKKQDEKAKESYDKKKALIDDEQQLLKNFTKEQQSIYDEQLKNKEVQLAKQLELEAKAIEDAIQLEQKGIDSKKAAREKDVLDYFTKLSVDKTATFTERENSLKELMDIELKAKELTEYQKEEIRKKYAGKEKELEKEKINNVLEITKQGLIAGQQLSDTFFSIKNANLKKGSAEEEKAARNQFKINKAFSMSTTAIATAQGVISALGAFPFTPVNIAKSVAVGLAGVAAIAKIAGTQFGGAPSGGGAPASIGGGGGASGTPAPSFQAPTFFGLGQVTQKASGDSSAQKVYVTEGDISSVQKRVGVIESRARIS